MKKLTLLALIALTAHTTLRAQLTKQSWMVGGSIAFTSATNTQTFGGVTSTLFSITPKAGYFIIDRLAAGVSVAAAFSHYHYNSQPNPQTFNSSIYGIGPFVRYYFLPTQKPTNILVEVYDLYSTNTATGNSNTHTNEYGFAAGPAFFLSPSVALELTLGYYWDKGPTAYPTTPTTHTFKTALGFQVYLPGKHHKA